MRNINTHSKAFTMLELVFVIVVLGILAALALPRMDRDLKQEAADNVLSAIRYTQHLALIDNKTDPTDGEWQKKFWSIHFTTAANGSYYNVGSDANKVSGLEKTETAIDPTNGKYMYHLHTNPVQVNESPNILIGQKYGITAIDATSCKNNNSVATLHLGFDHLGRPHQSFGGSTVPNYSSYKKVPCTFKFTMSNGDDFSITIEPETGYAYIVGQPNS